MIDCPKCRAKMDEGFIREMSPSVTNIMKWIEGQPERSFWHGIKVKGRRQIEVASWRCTRCGYLELYAR